MKAAATFTFIASQLALWSFGSAQASECVSLDIQPDTHCETVNTWDEFVALVDGSIPGDELYLCPFSIDKEDADPVVIGWELKLICLSTSDTDRCDFKGTGLFVEIASGGDTLMQGFTFREGDDYGVHVTSGAEGSSLATHTFCYCRFTKFSRMETSRGGAFMTQGDSGTINLFYCFFGNNYSFTRGAAVYARSNQVNIIGSNFTDNTALEYGGAIYTAGDSNLYIEGTTFIRNYGKDDFGIIVNPRAGTSVWEDGGDNVSEDGPCDGFYMLRANECQTFITPE
eukprot:Nitzschia sp. Nitz4//scaffold4_size323378//203636//204642//NITZ4_000675-RA/size323378-snap-gene-0.422-mRNA-1//1//CDS//3329553444//6537//frame0